jgi:peptide/nickel transport system permease protein
MPAAGRPRHVAPSTLLGGALLLLFMLVAAVGPLLAPYSPLEQNLDRVLEGPTWAHWLGTDENGVDLLSQLLYGAQLAFLISGIVVLLSATTGVSLGVVAGFHGGLADELVMRLCDLLLAFPGILLNIAIVALVAEPGIGALVAALVANGWVSYARVARGQVLAVRQLEFVSAARCLGASTPRILWRHVLPNILSPVLVQMTFSFGGIILVEASLSFLGLGPQLPYTWGALLDQGTTYLWKTQRLALVPGLAIMLVVLGANLLGDGLRDRLDPRRDRRE